MQVYTEQPRLNYTLYKVSYAYQAAAVVRCRPINRALTAFRRSPERPSELMYMC